MEAYCLKLREKFEQPDEAKATERVRKSKNGRVLIRSVEIGTPAASGVKKKSGQVK